MEWVIPEKPTAAHLFKNSPSLREDRADPSDRGFQGVGLRVLDCWDRGFESRRDYACFLFRMLCFVYAVDSATSRSLVQRSPTGCVYLIACDLETSKRGCLGLIGALALQENYEGRKFTVALTEAYY